MPPKPKYSAEEIVRTAYGIARDMGIDAVSAREVAARLNTSPSPIFTVFSSMEELKAQVWNLATAELYERVTRASERSVHPYKAVGKEIIDFSATEPNLFRLLFLRPDLEPSGSRRTTPNARNLADQSVETIVREYGLTPEMAQMLFNQMWVYVMGLCAMITSRLIVPTEKEVDGMLTFQFTALMTLIAPDKVPAELQSPPDLGKLYPQ